jgi:TRAP-type C4-dicarboxylate transport system permease large subunit
MQTLILTGLLLGLALLIVIYFWLQRKDYLKKMDEDIRIKQSKTAIRLEKKRHNEEMAMAQHNLKMEQQAWRERKRKK